MSKLTIVANVYAHEGELDRVKSQLLKLVLVTRAEPGCITYELHMDNENPLHFMFFEVWSSRELWQEHMGAAHIAAYRAATEDAVVNFTLNEMTDIS